MRKLNKTEQAIVQTISSRCRNAKCFAGKELRVQYHTVDNRITIAEVTAGNARRFGISTYNKDDRKMGLPYSEEIGQRIALSRALRS